MDNRVSHRTVMTGLTAMIAVPAIIAPARAEWRPLTPQEVSGERVTLTIRDYSPCFLDFHAAAQGLDPHARWKGGRIAAASPQCLLGRKGRRSPAACSTPPGRATWPRCR